jgi:hypothetical protein
MYKIGTGYKVGRWRKRREFVPTSEFTGAKAIFPLYPSGEESELFSPRGVNLKR